MPTPDKKSSNYMQAFPIPVNTWNKFWEWYYYGSGIKNWGVGPMATVSIYDNKIDTYIDNIKIFRELYDRFKEETRVQVYINK